MLKVTPIVLLALLLFHGCSVLGLEPSYEERTSYVVNQFPNNDSNADTLLTCISYNIQCGFPINMSPWTASDIGATKKHIQSLAQHIKTLNPDIVCLQEVARNRSNMEVKNLLEELAKELNMNYAFGAHGYNDATGVEPVQGEWGNAVLSRFTIESMENVEVERIDVWQRRSILSVIVKNGTKRMAVSSLHFIPTENSATQGARYFSNSSSPFNQIPHIIGGDFNMGAVKELEQIGLTDATATSIPGGSIDKVFCSTTSFTVVKAGEHTKGFGDPTDTLSDHRAVFAVLLLTK